MKNLLLAFAALVVFGGGILLVTAQSGLQSGSEQQRLYEEPKRLCEIADQSINESSGIGASHVEADVYYTHNDSGDSPRFFKFDLAGKVLGTYSLKGAKAIDWEDMASVVLRGKPYLYFADIGDNGKIRGQIDLYRVVEPLRSGGEIADVEHLAVEYPDGPHNAEACFVDPHNGDVYIVTKVSGKPSQVFRAQNPSFGSRAVLSQVGELKLGGKFAESQLVTGADMSPEGSHVVVRTYFNAYEYKVPSKREQWVKAEPTYVKLAFEAQGESIAYSRDGRSLVTTSEGSPCPVTVIRQKR